MKQLNLWSFYVIGFQIHKLKYSLLSNNWGFDPNQGIESVNKMLLIFTDAQEALKALQNSRNAALRLIDLVYKCKMKGVMDTSRWMLTKDGLPSETIKDFSQLAAEVSHFEAIFSNELESISTFFVPQKGTHQTLGLMERAVNNVSADVRANLSQEAINDINAAGKCLALELPTAAGFHILRAVESLIFGYHNKLTAGGAPTKLTSRSWGSYIQKLEEKGADVKITGFLRHIKDEYRNPIVHPEAVLTIDDAFLLFHTSLSAINMLGKEIYT